MNWKFKTFPRPLLAVCSPWSVALLALAVYALTLCRGAYPGVSAANIAVIGGLVPEHLSAHPVWRLICLGVAHLPLGTLPLRLNALSAVCGAGATLLLGTLVARLLYALISEDAGGAASAIRSKDRSGKRAAHAADVSDDIPASVRAHNRRAAIATTIGGAVAALGFAFSAACWSASTRLQLENFDALLLLAAGHLLLTYDLRRQRPDGLAMACLCGAGCVESAVFLVSAPVFFGFTLRRVVVITQKRRKVRAQLLLALFVAAIVGAFANLLLLCGVNWADASGSSSLLAALADTVRLHRTMLKGILPQVGWVWIVGLVFVPLAVAALSGRRAFRERPVLLSLTSLFLTLANVLGLANASFSPWGQAREGSHLPVMAAMALAAMAGYLFVYWRLLAAPADQSGQKRLHRLDKATDFWMGSIMMWVPLAAVCLVPFANLHEASGRRGEFVERLTRSVLAHLGDRTWVASDDLLDNHLRLAAQSEGRALRVINLDLDKNPARQAQLRTWIDADPHFAASRMRMENAAALGASAFIDEWLHDDPAAARALFVIDAPETWLRSGWHPVPEGYGFGGVPSLTQVKGDDLLSRNRADWDRLAAILAPSTNLPPPLERVRQTLCRQTSRAADELGVLLEDLGRTNEASEAYAAAIRLDRHNVCALMNQMGLPENRDKPDAQKKLAKEVQSRMDDFRPRPSTLGLVLMFGAIHQSDVLAQSSRAWSFLGQPAIAQNQLDRAMALAPANAGIQQLLAETLATRGDTAAAARAYRAAVDADGNNTTAMLGLASMCLSDGRTAEARQWIDRARKAGADEPAWAVPHASLLLSEGQTNAAVAYLKTFTENNPTHLMAWTIEADILLKQRALDEVEQQVLPAMYKAVPPHTDNFLVHLVRAHLLAAKTPVDYHTIRAALLHALNLRPDLTSVRNDLLHMDIESGNPEALQQDVDATLRFDRDHALANFLAGTLLVEKGELKRAEDYFRRSLAVHPTAEAFNNLAETLRRLGQLPAAEQAAREATVRDPKSGNAWDTLGCTLLDENRADEAGKAIEQALALRGQDPGIRLNLARVRLAQGRLDDCRQILRHPGVAPEKLSADLRRQAEDLERRAAQAQPARP